MQNQELKEGPPGRGTQAGRNVNVINKFFSCTLCKRLFEREAVICQVVGDD